MRKIVLGKSGLEVTALGFGGIPIQRVSDDDAVAAIHAALDCGINFIDTASGYGDSQKKIGKAIAGRTDGLILASKSGRKGKDEVLEDIDRSRREMGVDCVDLYQFHGVSSEAALEQTMASGGAMEGFREAKDRGWIGHIGITSHSLDMALKLVEMDEFETLQFPFNLVTAEPAEELIPRCRERNIGFIVMKPLCGGQFDDAELAFRFLNAYPDLAPIPGIERPEEIRQIAEIVESGRVLEGSMKAKADEIVARLGKLFCRRCGYCQPCPQEIPITMGMIFDGFARRLPPDRVKGMAQRLVDAFAQCQDCRACERQCPYELPIVETLRKNVDLAKDMLSA